METTWVATTLGTWIVVIVVCGATPLRAQRVPPSPSILPGWSVASAIRTVGAYEDNPLFTTAKEISASFLVVTPIVETRLRTPTRSFEAGYSFDAEKYTQSLAFAGGAFAKQRAFATLQSALGPRTSLTVDTSYLSTNRPEEVLEDSGIVASRRRAQDYSASLLFTRSLSPRVGWETGYALSLQDLGEPTEVESSARGVLHTVNTRFSIQRSSRTSNWIDFTGQFLVGEERDVAQTTRASFASSVVRYRWTWAASSRVNVELMAGPRFSEEIDPTVSDGAPMTTRRILFDAFASLGYQNAGQETTLVYTRSQFQAFGLSGFINTDNLQVTVAYRSSQRVQWIGRGGTFRTSDARSRVVGYRLDAGTNVQLAPRLTLEAAYRFQYQDRPLLSEGGGVMTGPGARSRNSVTVAGILHSWVDLR